jgi:DNA-binding MarR family transcriptional regulator
MSKRDLAVSAWESLFRAQVSVMRCLVATFPSREISLNEYDVLFNLSRQPGRRIRLRDLNQHVLLSQPSVSRLVDRLVSRGYVEKESDPADGRGALVTLTDAGYALFRRVAVAHMASISERVGSALSENELAQLITLCDRLRDGGPADQDHVSAPGHAEH